MHSGRHTANILLHTIHICGCMFSGYISKARNSVVQWSPLYIWFTAFIHVNRLTCKWDFVVQIIKLGYLKSNRKMYRTGYVYKKPIWSLFFCSENDSDTRLPTGGGGVMWLPLPDCQWNGTERNCQLEPRPLLPSLKLSGYSVFTDIQQIWINRKSLIP